MPRPAVAEVNLSAILHNYKLACEVAPNSQSIAVVKANAYGHGAAKVCQYLEPYAPAFAVAAIEEAIEIRQAGVTKPILLLEGTFGASDVTIAAENKFWLMVENLTQVNAITSQFQAEGLNVWLKIDTGMHRLGLTEEEFHLAYQQLSACGWVNKNIVFASHFSCADELDNEVTQEQIIFFDSAISRYPRAKTSLANSAAILAHKNSHRDWNRPGYMLYGGRPVDHENSNKIKAPMTLKSGIISIREIDAGESVGYSKSWTAPRRSKIATVAMGYGDGYPRHMPKGTPVLVNGVKAPLAGRVSMDMLTVDVTDLKNVKIGDEVILWGEQLPIDELASYGGTIGYELVTRMTGRVPIKYIEE